ncbi:epoxyqueuosine reductase QueH [Peptoniphilus stercorisuis]|uniref:Epoxyqueuosine reductase QueH n=1 Tax=Peptoniphilus stercorisuis TaxID=1436965 RepID=A0ABS4KE22_9FIRM|nr:epoxyqueuosine reductase QueH [Peptoniphilus stercorisuis]MBP2026020.1 putative adenine nucleotide alpha hydrolase (AANH) superfamily ATPase [Peptoniphilus stercorisuis]
MNKVNYDLEMENIIKNLEKKKEKSLLLHSCCGPCSSGCIERLNEFFNITVFYYNPNLDIEEEFDRRAIEQKRLIKEMNLSDEINVIVPKYNSKEYYDAINGYEMTKEGGARCTKCFELRLREAAKMASEGGFDYFTTTLSISPYKNSTLLNTLGEKIAEEYSVNYLFSDFKKKNGYKRSIELSKEYNMYRQDYCGCVFSKEEAEERRRDK